MTRVGMSLSRNRYSTRKREVLTINITQFVRSWFDLASTENQSEARGHRYVTRF